MNKKVNLGTLGRSYFLTEASMHIATRRKAPHSTRLNLEALERRDTPAVSVSAVGNELQLNFSGNDQLSVHSSSGSKSNFEGVIFC